MKSIKVLIIEDDTLIAMQLENALENLGHTVVDNVRCGKEALSVASTNPIDLVISDVNIEGEIDGITLSKTLYEQYSTPIIFITAYKDKETLKRASKIDFVGYIIKPFREDELEALINIAIYKYNLPKLKLKLTIDDTYSYCMKNNELFSDEELIPLTKTETKFIQLLINSKGEIVSYNTIEQNLWEGTVVTDDTRRQLIYRFKKKLPNFPLKLKKGFGYRLFI
jgi:DNA-binding response OmpR family regulator